MEKEKQPGAVLARLLLLVLGTTLLISFLERSEADAPAYVALALRPVVGIFCILKTSEIIGVISQTLKYRTGIAAGVLQAMGTALPDMAIGILAAFLSLREASGDYRQSVQYGMIAGSTTLGSNIYNILFASWCVWRQNLSDRKNGPVPMFPPFKSWGELIPLARQHPRPTRKEISASVALLLILSVVTAAISVSLVLSGKIENSSGAFHQDIFQFGKIPALIILLVCLSLMYAYRKAKLTGVERERIARNAGGRSVYGTWFSLLIAAVILFVAANMVIGAITGISRLTAIPVEVLGVATAFIGCLGEMTIIYDFSTRQNGTIVDAITGVTMDNFVTFIGTCLIALIGGMYLGSSAFIIIFILIMLANTILIVQTSNLKDVYPTQLKNSTST